MFRELSWMLREPHLTGDATVQLAGALRRQTGP
jgi:hypothetical protein